LTIQGTFAIEMVQAPENSLRDSDSLLGMVARAGARDTVLVEQLYEYTYWGDPGSNPASDPNPRLEAYIAAARRGATVRLLLDSVYDDPGDPRGNNATCDYANGIALDQGLDLACRVANPTGNGIHNKMVLVLAGGEGYVHTGSINGSENSSKNNREFAVQVQSRAAHDYLAGVFWYDWGVDLDRVLYLPAVLRCYPTPTATPECLVMCTPPACEPDEVYYCPATCPCGCGVECATRTPVPDTGAQPLGPQGRASLGLLGVTFGVVGYAGLAAMARRQ
jgi:hypothetical protein